MTLSRRALFGTASLGVTALALAACTTGTFGNPLGTTITVNLAAAQAEAKAILEAVQIVAASATVALSKAAQVSLSNDLNVLTTAVSEFAGLPSGSTSMAAFAGDVVTAIGAVMALLPLPSGTALAVAEGVALIKALIAGLSAITITTPVATGVAKASLSARVIAAPIPIPLS
ncbi:hypothetical protein [Acidiphilium sp.]|uniref:hypothetical protein n=1 Tax=Acidiphilium sp. TaxID=527 RepID=UPI003D01567C